MHEQNMSKCHLGVVGFGEGSGDSGQGLEAEQAVSNVQQKPRPYDIYI